MSAEYDVIFAGGGLAACVTAGRLAAAEPNLKILVVESGPHSETLEQIYVPGIYLSNMFPGTTTQKFHLSNPVEHLNGRVAFVPTGNCLGGGSAVNSMIYARGAASDFDEWKDFYKNEGWGAQELLPLMRKLETWQVNPKSPTHGDKGPLKGSLGNTTQFGLDLLEIAKKYDPRGAAEDSNDLTTIDKWVLWPKWVDETTGRRSDAATGYIYTQKANKNLVISTDSLVKRVVFDGTRAVGVEYTTDGKEVTARAGKLVVVAAGTFGSSAILERSGVGNPTLLKSLGIETVVDLPGVGADYQDHQLLKQGIYLDDAAETLDFAHGGYQEATAAKLAEWKATGGKNILSSNGIETGIKLKPTDKELQSYFSPEFQKFWKETYASKADKALVWCGGSAGLLGPHDDWPVTTKMSMFCSMLFYPESHGHLHIKSKNPQDPLDFDCGFLRSPHDLEALRYAYKRTREFARRHPMYRGEVAQLHPPFPEGSKAAVSLPPQTPVAIDAPDLVYSAEDDKIIDKFIGENVSTTWHSMATCPMKPRADGGVVDNQLNVYGTQNLKVVDLSVCPSNIGANTASAAALIGEKAATIIAKELGIQNV
jgi:alcohol oxidase